MIIYLKTFIFGPSTQGCDVMVQSQGTSLMVYIFLNKKVI